MWADGPAPGAREGLFSGGMARPVLPGAARKVILAHRPPHQLRALFGGRRNAIAAAGLGADWESFRATLRAIRDAGHCVTQSEFMPGIIGIAAPLFNADRGVLGSIGIAAPIASPPAATPPLLAERVMQAAREACAPHPEQPPVPAAPARPGELPGGVPPSGPPG